MPCISGSNCFLCSFYRKYPPNTQAGITLDCQGFLQEEMTFLENSLAAAQNNHPRASAQDTRAGQWGARYTLWILPISSWRIFFKCGFTGQDLIKLVICAASSRSLFTETAFCPLQAHAVKRKAASPVWRSCPDLCRGKAISTTVTSTTLSANGNSAESK